jgi:hypothetical protein
VGVTAVTEGARYASELREIVSLTEEVLEELIVRIRDHVAGLPTFNEILETACQRKNWIEWRWSDAATQGHVKGTLKRMWEKEGRPGEERDLYNPTITSSMIAAITAEMTRRGILRDNRPWVKGRIGKDSSTITGAITALAQKSRSDYKGYMIGGGLLVNTQRFHEDGHKADEFIEALIEHVVDKVHSGLSHRISNIAGRAVSQVAQTGIELAVTHMSEEVARNQSERDEAQLRSLREHGILARLPERKPLQPWEVDETPRPIRLPGDTVLRPGCRGMRGTPAVASANQARLFDYRRFMEDCQRGIRGGQALLREMQEEEAAERRAAVETEPPKPQLTVKEQLRAYAEETDRDTAEIQRLLLEDDTPQAVSSQAALETLRERETWREVADHYRTREASIAQIRRARPEMTDIEADKLRQLHHHSTHLNDTMRRVHTQTGSHALAITAAEQMNAHVLRPAEEMVGAAVPIVKMMDPVLGVALEVSGEAVHWVESKVEDGLTALTGSEAFGEAVAPVTTQLALAAAPKVPTVLRTTGQAVRSAVTSAAETLGHYRVDPLTMGSGIPRLTKKPAVVTQATTDAAAATSAVGEVPVRLELPYVESGRSVSGTAMMGSELSNPPVLMRGTHHSAGKVPLEVAEKMNGKTFESFDAFRKAFWKTMADSSYAKEFGEASISDMRKGIAPRVHDSQWLGKRRSLELHHRTPIQDGGAVYDLSNILVVTPRYHLEVLERATHYGASK